MRENKAVYLANLHRLPLVTKAASEIFKVTVMGIKHFIISFPCSCHITFLPGTGLLYGFAEMMLLAFLILATSRSPSLAGNTKRDFLLPFSGLSSSTSCFRTVNYFKLRNKKNVATVLLVTSCKLLS